MTDDEVVNDRILVISFDYNKIDLIFNQNLQLHLFDFTGNQVKFVHENIFHHLHSYTVFTLLDTPITCDCYAIHSKNYVLKSQFHDHLYLQCATPTEYHDQKIHMVNFSRCYTVPKKHHICSHCMFKDSRWLKFQSQ